MTVRTLRMMMLWVFFDLNMIHLHTGLPHALLPLFLLLLGLSCHRHHPTGAGTMYPGVAWHREDTPSSTWLERLATRRASRLQPPRPGCVRKGRCHAQYYTTHLSSKGSKRVKKNFGRREVTGKRAMGKRKAHGRERLTEERSNGGHT
jgi:hypothetical protein